MLNRYPKLWGLVQIIGGKSAVIIALYGLFKFLGINENNQELELILHDILLCIWFLFCVTSYISLGQQQNSPAKGLIGAVFMAAPLSVIGCAFNEIGFVYNYALCISATLIGYSYDRYIQSRPKIASL